MTTIKSYTDLQQSKKLAEILPLESADMWYQHTGISIKEGSEKSIYFPMVIRDCESDEDIPCWSLAALLELLPKSARLEKGNVTELYRVTLPVELESSDWYADPIDACYELILKLHELNLL